MKYSTLIASSALAAGLALSVSIPAQAAFNTTSCANGFVSGSNSCAGSYSGNDTGNQGTALTNLNSGIFDGLTGWQLADKSDDSSSLSGFTINAQQGQTTGTWSIAKPSSFTGSFVVSLKASNFYSLYYFNASNGTTGGTFSTAGVAVGNPRQYPDLSHASLFVTNNQAIPEPLTILGTGTALAFGTFFKKRLGKKSK